jgi:DNA helicase-2/ATP-dependent DNA helicase PcrA
LRTDGIEQVPSVDSDAPNMSSTGVKQGTVRFLYSESEELEPIRKYLSTSLGWNFSDAKATKELNLTHNLIAEKAGFGTLMAIYDKDRILELKARAVKEIKEGSFSVGDAATFGEVLDQLKISVSATSVAGKFIAENPKLYAKARAMPFSVIRKTYASKDQLVDDKKQDEEDDNKPKSQRDNLVRHLFKIQNCITLYQKGSYNEFLQAVDFKVRSVADKTLLRDNITKLAKLEDMTIESAITLAHEGGICIADEKLERFRRENEYVYDRVKEVRFEEFRKLFDYLEGRTPFSTQHKTKGAQFDHVLVVLDNGSWNLYNFNYLFLGTGNPKVLERTQKIFYVCCTRTKESLAVFYHKPSSSVLTKAKEWFGEANVFQV